VTLTLNLQIVAGFVFLGLGIVLLTVAAFL